MMKIDLVSSSIAISVFLLFYYASVSVLTIFWVVTFNRSTSDANGMKRLVRRLSAGLVVAGVLSDWAKVRKPFMLFGAVCAMVMMAVLIRQTGHPHTGYYANVLVIVLLAVSSSIAYTPWMANYTEQVESRNPALTASGLAVWGWILRITVALSFLVLPYVVTTSTVLVDNQTAATVLQAIEAAQPYTPSTSPVACACRSRRQRWSSRGCERPARQARRRSRRFSMGATLPITCSRPSVPPADCPTRRSRACSPTTRSPRPLSRVSP